MINGQCRPKNPNFKLTKIPFKDSDLLAFNKIYIADDKTNAMGYGFYPDGRIIYVHSKDGLTLKIEDLIGSKKVSVLELESYNSDYIKNLIIELLTKIENNIYSINFSNFSKKNVWHFFT